MENTNSKIVNNQINPEEIRKQLYESLSEGNVKVLQRLFQKGSEESVALITFFLKVAEIQENSYTYKAIHEDIDKDTRDIYITMSRVAKQTPMIMDRLMGLIVSSNKSDIITPNFQ